VSAWRERLGSSIFSPGGPALAGELRVSTTRTSNGKLFGWAPRLRGARGAGPEDKWRSIGHEPCAQRADRAGPVADRRPLSRASVRCLATRLRNEPLSRVSAKKIAS
jgi:hypothetical protein